MGFLKLFGSKESDQKYKKAQQASIKSVFLSDQHKMIHDLKTPLNGISGMTQLLRETPLDAEQEEYVGVIEESIRAMLDQITKLSSGTNQETRFVTVEIRGFLQRFLALLREDMKSGEFTVHYKVDRQFPIQLCLEETLLQELMLMVFKRLFLNRGKPLMIEALYPTDEDYVLLVLRDKSLTYEDELSHVSKSPFEEIFEAKLETSSLRYNLMQSLDGKVRFELYAYYQREGKEHLQKDKIASGERSQEREVSSAEIEEIREEQTVHYAAHKDFSDNKLVLIAEDEVVGRVTLKLMLKERFDIVFAKNGKEAVELYMNRKPDLVLMDIMMPVMNGFEAFDEIEKRDKHRSPIIACTSKVISTEREYLTSYGFDDHLDKPIENERLDEILTKYLNT